MATIAANSSNSISPEPEPLRFETHRIVLTVSVEFLDQLFQVTLLEGLSHGTEDLADLKGEDGQRGGGDTWVARMYPLFSLSNMLKYLRNSEMEVFYSGGVGHTFDLLGGKLLQGIGYNVSLEYSDIWGISRGLEGVKATVTGGYLPWWLAEGNCRALLGYEVCFYTRVECRRPRVRKTRGHIYCQDNVDSGNILEYEPDAILLGPIDVPGDIRRMGRRARRSLSYGFRIL